MNSKIKKPLPAWLPFVVGTLLVIQFAALGAWQVSRGFEKRATHQAFQGEASFTPWQSGMAVRSYQHLEVSGQFDTDHQFLLENIIVNSRYGYYVITPLLVNGGQSVLLVNRGWLEKAGDGPASSVLALSPEFEVVRGRAGSLPKAGYKMGDAVDAASSWPKRAVYPSLDDVAAALGREVEPFVLLLDHRAADGFLRNWAPTEFGPGKHFGYALQWFAMGAVLSGLLIWNYRRKRFDA